MRIRFDCRHCGAGITASDWDSGRAILCSGCNRENIVPTDMAPALEAAPVPDVGVPDLSLGGGSRSQPQRNNYLLWGIGWSALAVVVIGGCVGAIAMLSRATREDVGPAIKFADFAEQPAPNVPEFRNAADEKSFQVLRETPVKGLDRVTFDELKRSRPRLGEHPLAMAVARRPSAGLGMPFTFGTDCTATDQQSRDLGRASKSLHSIVDQQILQGDRNAAWMENDPKWLKPEMVPGLTQILMAQDATWRMALVRILRKIDGPAATRGLVDRAVFDMNADVRTAAVSALKNRPTEEYADRLVSAFRHPWAPASEHAAEAVAALERTDLAPQLRELVDKPDPLAPTKKRIGIRDVTVQPQLVRVNHLKNCMYCHPTSTSQDDVVRGVAPDWDQPLPSGGYNGIPDQDTFVRADMTYLRQDFSLMMPVGEEDCRNNWPKSQRFDFFVCDKILTADEAAKYEQVATYPQREAVRQAIARLEKIVAK